MEGIAKYSIQFFLVGLLGVLLTSCIYDYEPQDRSLQGLGNSLVVIDGDIIVGGITNVKVSFTSALADDEREEIPIGTTAWVESETGDVYNGILVEDTTGVFAINTQNLSRNGKYRLVVSIPGRGDYISAFKPVMVSPPIDEITWSIAPDSTYANIEVTTHNSEAEKLYCKWNFTENWESNAVFIPYLDFNPNNNMLWELDSEERTKRSVCFSEAVSSDICIANTEKLSENLINKSVVRSIANTDMRAKGLYAISVTQKVLDKEGYMYWETLKRNIGQTGGIFSAQPTELVGNIVSVTNPDETVVGYTSVSTSSKMRVFIDWTATGFFKTECNYSTIKTDSEDFIKELKTFFYNGYRPVFMPEDGVLLYLSTLQCTDCRSYSNSTKPDFWPR